MSSPKVEFKLLARRYDPEVNFTEILVNVPENENEVLHKAGTYLFLIEGECKEKDLIKTEKKLDNCKEEVFYLKLDKIRYAGPCEKQI